MCEIPNSVALGVRPVVVRIKTFFARRIMREVYLAHTKELFQRLKILPYYNLYSMCVTLLMTPSFKHLQKPSHHYGTRRKTAGLLSLTEMRKIASRKSTIPNSIILYNNLPDVIRNYLENICVCSPKFIKRTLKTYYMLEDTSTLRALLY